MKLNAGKIVLAFCCAFAISLIIVCCSDDDDKYTPITGLDEAKLIMESLDTLRKALLVEVNQPQNNDVYAIDLTLSGLVSGEAKLAGIDTVSGFGGHSTYVADRKGVFSFSLDAYSNIGSYVLAKEGQIIYSFHSSGVSVQCFPEPECFQRHTQENLELIAEKLEVLRTIDGKEVKDLLDVTLSYKYTYALEGRDNVTDSSYHFHYTVKSSSGQVFEW